LLANYRTQSAAEAQRNALYSSEPLIRLSAVRAIPLDFNPSFIGDVARLLSDPVRRVRIAAAERMIGMNLDGLTDTQRKAFEDAMIEFRESQELSLDHAGAHRVLATLDRIYGRNFEAMQRLRTAIELEPYMSGPRGELASLLGEAQGDPDEVRKLREEEVELVERDSKISPDNAAIFYQLGMLRYLLGDFDKAQTALESASKLAPKNYDFLMALALLHDKRYEVSGDENQFNLAVDALKRLHEMRPEDMRAQSILVSLLEKRRLKQGGDPGAAPRGP
jgi:Flp pilus assembly protein TadD